MQVPKISELVWLLYIACDLIGKRVNMFSLVNKAILPGSELANDSVYLESYPTFLQFVTDFGQVSTYIIKQEYCSM